MDLTKFFRLYLDPAGQAGAGVAEETEGDVLAQQAYDEMTGKEPAKKKEPAEAEAEPAQKQPAEEEAEPQGQGEEKPAEEQAADEKAAEPQAAAKKAEEEAAAAGSAEPIADEVIQAHAEKQGMTFTEAKSDLEEAQKLLSKYKDPTELARAYRNQQREYDRLKAQAEKPAPVTPQLMTDAELKAEVAAYARENAEKIVAKYRANFPKRTEAMDEEAILEWAQEDAIKNYKQQAQETVLKIKNDAAAQRESLLATIPKEDARFVHDVRLILNNTPDRVVLNPKFGIKDLVWHAKGQRYDADLKAAEARGYKRGKEEPKIAGTVPGSGTASGGQKPSKPASAAIVLTAQQKQRALDQFPDSSPASAEAMWADLYKEDLKKNKNFLPS